jgi:AraC-like DNA-binding protein
MSILNDTDVEILTSPSRWELVSSLAEPDCASVENAEHKAFSADNTHSHPYREMMVALEGETLYGQNGRAYPARAGTIHYFSQHCPHDAEYPRNSPHLKHLWMGLMADRCIIWYIAFDQNGRHTEKIPFLLTPVEAGLHLDTTLFDMETRTDLDDAVKRSRCLGAISVLMSVLVEKANAPDTEQDPAAFRRHVVRTVQDHLRATAGRGDSLESLARIAGYGKYHFLRMFKEHTGRTVHEFIDECRTRKVQAMQAVDMTQAAMAEELGFACRQSFNRWLRNQRENSPQRRKERKGIS